MCYFVYIQWWEFSHVGTTKYLFADKGDLMVGERRDSGKWEAERITGAMSYVGKKWWNLGLALDGSIGKIEHIEQKQVGN